MNLCEVEKQMQNSYGMSMDRATHLPARTRIDHITYCYLIKIIFRKPTRTIRRDTASAAAKKPLRSYRPVRLTLREIVWITGETIGICVGLIVKRIFICVHDFDGKRIVVVMEDIL